MAKGILPSSKKTQDWLEKFGKKKPKVGPGGTKPRGKPRLPGAQGLSKGKGKKVGLQERAPGSPLTSVRLKGRTKAAYKKALRKR